MAKWSLALRVLPLAVLVAVIKAGSVVLGLELIAESPLLASVVTANVFLLGFLLAGTLSDYKESERLPGEVASSLESIAGECWILGTGPGSGHAEAAACMDDVAGVTRRVTGWFRGEVSADELLRSVNALDRHFLAFEPHTQANFISRLKSEQSSIRTRLVRMETIRRTGFVSAAYAIAEIGLGLLLVAMLLSDMGPVVQASFMAGVITFFLAYMILLIKDLDDPFEPVEQGGWMSGARGDEISSGPLDAALERISSMRSELDATPAMASAVASDR